MTQYSQYSGKISHLHRGRQHHEWREGDSCFTETASTGYSLPTVSFCLCCPSYHRNRNHVHSVSRHKVDVKSSNRDEHNPFKFTNDHQRTLHAGLFIPSLVLPPYFSRAASGFVTTIISMNLLAGIVTESPPPMSTLR